MLIQMGIKVIIELGGRTKYEYRHKNYYMAKSIYVDNEKNVTIIYINGDGVETKDYFTKKEVYDIQINN